MDPYQLLLRFLRAKLCASNEQTEQLSSEQLKEIYRLAKLHDLTYALGSVVLEGSLSSDPAVNAAFKKQCVIAAFRHEKIKHDLEIVCNAFCEAKIPHVPLKGAVIRELYDDPMMRTSCDVDILINKSDLERAQRVLTQELGFTGGELGSHDLTVESLSGTHVELHFTLLQEGASEKQNKVLDIDLDDPCFTANGYTLSMSDELFYYYHIAHMARHFVSGGCGIKPFMDLWILWNKTSFDIEKRKSLLEQGGLLTFANEAEGLMRVWFEGKEHNGRSLQMERFVIGGGVYGNLENLVSVQRAKSGSRLGFVISKIFLPYSTLKTYYPILEKHKWLTPFMQVRRWFGFLKRKNSGRIITELKANQSISTEQNGDMTAFLEELGIK